MLKPYTTDILVKNYKQINKILWHIIGSLCYKKNNFQFLKIKLYIKLHSRVGDLEES